MAASADDGSGTAAAVAASGSAAGNDPLDVLRAVMHNWEVDSANAASAAQRLVNAHLDLSASSGSAGAALAASAAVARAAAAADEALAELVKTFQILQEAASDLRIAMDNGDEAAGAGEELERRVQWLDEAVGMMRQELTLKTVMLDAIDARRDAGSRTTLVAYLSAWIVEPYFDVDRLRLIVAAWEGSAALKERARTRKRA